MDKNFWKTKKLSDFSEEEWEAVCMRCGKCCLVKERYGNIICFTNHICDGYDFKTGKCSRYATRICAECIKVDMSVLLKRPELLPESCAYRLLLAGKELPDYHPLVSGTPQTVHEAKQTVLEMPSIHSETEYKKAFEEYRVALFDENISLEECLAAKKKFESVQPVYLMVYDIPAKQ